MEGLLGDFLLALVAGEAPTHAYLLWLYNFVLSYTKFLKYFSIHSLAFSLVIFYLSRTTKRLEKVLYIKHKDYCFNWRSYSNYFSLLEV